MGQDDAEKRIAPELERHHGHDRSRSRRILIGLVVASAPIFIFCVLGYNAYAYRVGTPTTTTNVVCTGDSRHRHCTATWSLDGQSDTGDILGGLTEGDESVDVHVHGHTAYTAGAVHNALPLALLAVGASIGAFAVGFNQQSLRERRARRQLREP